MNKRSDERDATEGTQSLEFPIYVLVSISPKVNSQSSIYVI